MRFYAAVEQENIHFNARSSVEIYLKMTRPRDQAEIHIFENSESKSSFASLTGHIQKSEWN